MWDWASVRTKTRYQAGAQSEQMCVLREEKRKKRKKKKEKKTLFLQKEEVGRRYSPFSLCGALSERSGAERAVNGLMSPEVTEVTDS
ncbi:hypothetical protein INR49_020214 [Caranx melampygus]|nr:hypothetical protein INR49_020214 [Caranx melampygus]